MIRRLPGVRDVNDRRVHPGPVSAESVSLPSVAVAGFSPNWLEVNGGDIVAGRNFTPVEYAAGAHVVIINDKLAQSLFPERDPIGKTIKIFGVPFKVIGLHAEAVVALQQRRRAARWPSRTPPSSRRPTTSAAGWRSRWCPPTRRRRSKPRMT